MIEKGATDDGSPDILNDYKNNRAQFLKAKGRLFLRLGIMLSMQITKTIEGSTKCNNCNQVTNGKHI